MEYIKSTYKELHAIPEIGYGVKKTSKYIAKELIKFGYELITDVGENGIIGIMDSGVPGTTLALRADMDALQFEIGGEIVNIHACGHDANCTMALATAKEIAKVGIKSGKLLFLFQPAEEKGTGALAMINSGRLPKIDEMFSIHLRDYTELSLNQATPALVHSGVCMMSATIKGVSSHGARPHLGISAIDAGVLVVNAINSIRVDPKVTHSAKVTYFKSHGESFNTISDMVDLKIDIRSQTNEVLELLTEKVKNAVNNAALSIGAEAVINEPMSLNAAGYDEVMVEDARKSIVEILGNSQEALETTGSEDFHFFAKEGIKTTYFGLGADLRPGLHHPEMKFDINALEQGRNILLRFVEKRLG